MVEAGNRNEIVNLGDLFPRDLARDKLFLVDMATGETRTRGEADRRQRGVARALIRRGLKAGDRVAILGLNSLAYLDIYFGAMRAGLVAVPVNIRLADATIRFILEDSAVSLAFADDDRLSGLPKGMPAIGLGDGFETFLDDGPFETIRPGPHNTAMILYTSGSTGRPKGVPLSHAGQIWALSARRALVADPGTQRFLIAAPLYHMNALFNAKSVAFAGASAGLMPRFVARDYLEAIAKFRVTALTTIPTMMAKALKERDLIEALDFRSIERIGLGSAPCSAALRARIAEAFPGAHIALSYGTTEAGAAVFGPHPQGLAMPPMALGHPLPGSDVRLVGGPNADEGVLEMRNPAVMDGYLGLAEASARVLADGWYHSGDILRRDADGFYFFVGRADDMFVCSGENIYPNEVERLLETHPAILQACVVPASDDERGQVPVAFVVARDGATLSEAEVKRHALAHGPAYQHPRRVAVVNELPLAGTNKIDRRALAARAAEMAGVTP